MGSLIGKIYSPEEIHGKSAYQTALANGFKGTEKQWLESLKEPAVKAAESCMIEETIRQAKEEKRITAENERIANEQTRTQNEDTRKTAENERIANEQTRTQNEDTRKTAENERISNEALRENSERERESRFNTWETAIGSLPSYDARITRNDKRITNLEQGLLDDNFVTDSAIGYVKDVPSNALPYAEIKKVGGMSYKEGDTLKAAKVTAVKSVGVNLIPYPYIDTTKTVQGITFTDNGDRSITVNGTATSNAFFDLCQINFGDKSMERAYPSANGYVISGYVGDNTNGVNILYDTSNNKTHLRVYTGAVVNNVTVYPQMNRGTKALPYTPYAEHTLVIPSAVQALEGYGEGVNESIYNYIDYEKKQYVKNCDKKRILNTMGGYNETNNWYYVGFASLGLQYSKDFVCNLLPLTDITGGAYGIGHSNTHILLRIEGCNNASDYKQWLFDNECYVYGKITPEVTDISDLLPADNLIKVEGGGTITAVNEYEYDVPSEIEYQLEA